MIKFKDTSFNNEEVVLYDCEIHEVWKDEKRGVFIVNSIEGLQYECEDFEHMTEEGER